MTLTLTPMIFNLGPTELIIILVIILLLFGGSRLAGLGKSTGRALKEFKEETKGLTDKDKTTEAGAPPTVAPPTQVTNGQNFAPGQAPWPQTPPSNRADPSASDVRKDA